MLAGPTPTPCRIAIARRKRTKPRPRRLDRLFPPDGRLICGAERAPVLPEAELERLWGIAFYQGDGLPGAPKGWTGQEAYGVFPKSETARSIKLYISGSSMMTPAVAPLGSRGSRRRISSKA